MSKFQMKLILKYVFATTFFITISPIVIFFTSSDRDREVKGWGKDVPRNINLYITEGNPQILPSNFCKSQVSLLLMVTSAPSNVDARQAIRQTLGSQKTILGESVNVLFFTGNSLEPSIQDALLLESEEYKDIIQENFTDSYNNLTLKSVLILKVASENCINKAKYVMKTDDDMFVNLPILMNLLIEKNEFKNLLIGRMFCGSKPIRDPLVKTYVPFYMYSNTLFPNYLSGTGYVMSLDVTKSLYDAVLKIPLIHIEDVFVTGIGAKNSGINIQNSALFTSGIIHEICHIKKVITIHGVPPERIRRIFQALNEPDILKKCSTYKPMFKVYKWIKDTFFVPMSRLKRQQICF